MVDDETLFKTMQVANETGGLVMVHAENGDAIDVIVKEAVAAGKSDPIWHARTRPMETEAEATNRADPARAGRGRRAVRRPRLLPAGGRADRARAREGLGRLGRDLHPVPVRRRLGARAAELRGREVHLHAAAAAEGRSRSTSGRRSRTTSSRSSRPTTARSTGPSRRGSTAATSRSSRTAGRGSRTGCTCCTSSASAPGGSR